MLRAGLIGGDEGQVDFGLRRRGELDLRLFGGFLQALQGQLVILEVDAVVLLEFLGEEINQDHVEVFTTQEGVTIGGLHLEHAVADLEDRHVERTAAKVIDGNRLAVGLVQAIGKRCRSRLIDDAQHFEAGDLARVLGGLTLGVVEIGRHGDHRLLDRLAEIALGGFLHLLQDEGRDLLRRIFLAARFHPGRAVLGLDDGIGHHALVLLHRRVGDAAADEALDRKQGVFGVGDRLALGRLTGQAFAVLGKGHHGRRRARALGILDDFRVGPVHDRDARVGRAKVNANDFRHLMRLHVSIGGPG